MWKADERCWSTSSTGVKHPYYLCMAKGCGRYRKSVRRDAIETRFSELLKQLVPSTKLIDLARAMFKEAWRQRTAQSSQMGTTERLIEAISHHFLSPLDLVALTSPQQQKDYVLEVMDTISS